jgi:3-phenylpropionate/trans-cinnamate dioxygenase ferredoxin reductase component
MTEPDNRRFVIVGGSLAGAKAAETLRADGFTGHVVIVEAGPERPYERPPLSKGYLAGSDEREKVYVHPEGWYAENNVELRLNTRVNGLDRTAKQLSLESGEQMPYDRLLLTTGSVVRRLDVPGADLDGVHYLRELADSDAIKAEREEGKRLVVIGAGWIGLEVAATARQHGAVVTVIETLALPLQRVLGDEVAQVFADLHREHGVDLRLNSGVDAILGEGGRVSGVRLTDGTELPADAVLVGVGIRPATELAEAAGLEVDNGVLVDQGLRTADPDVFAAGDVANAFNPLFGERLRVEHWANALNGGVAAAKSMLGEDVVYDRVPYFFSDQYDLGMEYSGYAPSGAYDRVVFRGSKAGREFVAFWLSDRRVLAGMNVNIWDVTDAIQDLVRSGRTVDPAKLADPSVPLSDA